MIAGPDLFKEIWKLIGDYKEEYVRVQRYERAQDEYENLVSVYNPDNPMTKTRINRVMRDLRMFQQGIIGLRDTYKMAFAMQYLHGKFMRGELPDDMVDELDNMGAETNNFTQTIIRNINDKVSHLMELLSEKDKSH